MKRTVRMLISLLTSPAVQLTVSRSWKRARRPIAKVPSWRRKLMPRPASAAIPTGGPGSGGTACTGKRGRGAGASSAWTPGGKARASVVGGGAGKGAELDDADLAGANLAGSGRAVGGWAGAGAEGRASSPSSAAVSGSATKGRSVTSSPGAAVRSAEGWGGSCVVEGAYVGGSWACARAARSTRGRTKDGLTRRRRGAVPCREVDIAFRSRSRGAGRP